MQKLVPWALGLVVIALSFGAGYKHGQKMSPSWTDFQLSEEFDELVVEELRKRKTEQSWGYSYSRSIDISLNGPVMTYSRGNEKIAVILIRDEIVYKLFNNFEEGALDEERWEILQPLVQSVATRIMGAES